VINRAPGRFFFKRKHYVNALQVHRFGDLTFCSSFSADAGCEEFFVTIRTRPGLSVGAALDELCREYEGAAAHQGLSGETVVFSRLFVSDLSNQRDMIDKSDIAGRLRPGAFSVIEQKPVGGGQFSLFSFHLRRLRGKNAPEKQVVHVPGSPANHCLASMGSYRLLFTARYSSGAGGAYDQTREVFDSFNRCLESNAMSLPANAVRTWIFVRDIDTHYKDMVRARREYFTAHGLTDKTRYLASTGIEGVGALPANLVTMDSLSIGGLAQDQIVRMEAPTHLSPTILYNVTFERGLRIRFGDRSHLYISGTASVNNKGDVVHTGDVQAQTRRTVENLRALLQEHGATLSDMAYVLVYIRNFHEWDLVSSVLKEEFGDTIPLISCEARVCRPTWLFELEGVAIIPDQNEFPPFA
jgi:enamine deaminase RidA (YjgF/YER057c/UK114 family)